MNAPTDIAAPLAVKLTVDAFEVLHREGFLDDHRRAELIDGNITQMSPLGIRHSVVLSGLLYRLTDVLRGSSSDLVALSAPTIALPPHNAPEPDIVVARLAGRNDGYIAREQVALVIEVSDSTLAYDLTTKRDLYASATIPELWVVDVRGDIVQQFWAPVDGRYTQHQSVVVHGQLQAATIPDLAIDGSGIV